MEKAFVTVHCRVTEAVYSDIAQPGDSLMTIVNSACHERIHKSSARVVTNAGIVDS